MASRTFKLKDVCSVLSGFAFKSNYFSEEGMPLIRIRDVVRGYSETCYAGDYDDRYVVQSGEILIGMDGDFNLEYWEGGPALLNQRVCKVTPDENALNKAFLYFFLPLKLKEIWEATPYVTVKHLSSKDVENIEIPAWPLETQKHIARVLEQADQLRKQAQQMESELNQLAQSLFLEMFGDPDSNPQKWPVSAIGELASVETGGTPSRNNESFYGGDIPWVKTGEVCDEYIFSTEERITDLAIKETNCKVFPADTVLVAMYGQGKTRGKVGVLKVPASTNQACAAILPSDVLLPGFLFDFLKLRYLALRGLGRGGNQENLNLTIIKEFPIYVPPVTSQEEYLRTKAHIDKALKDNGQNMLFLNDTFESLVQRAFKGELTAPGSKAA